VKGGNHSNSIFLPSSGNKLASLMKLGRPGKTQNHSQNVRECRIHNDSIHSYRYARLKKKKKKKRKRKERKKIKLKKACSITLQSNKK
jgi:hypothetical protein